MNLILGTVLAYGVVVLSLMALIAWLASYDAPADSAPPVRREGPLKSAYRVCLYLMGCHASEPRLYQVAWPLQVHGGKVVVHKPLPYILTAPIEELEQKILGHFEGMPIETTPAISFVPAIWLMVEADPLRINAWRNN